MAPEIDVFLGLAHLGVQKRFVVDDAPRSIALVNKNVMLVAAKHEVFRTLFCFFDAEGAHRDVAVDREAVSLNGLLNDSMNDRFHSHSRL